MTTKTIKVILFTSLIAAMILPFSVMTMAEAAPNENANDKAKDKKFKEPKPMTMEEMKNDKQKPKERHEPSHEKGEYPKLRNLAAKDNGISTQGTGHEAFGTLLNQDTSSQTGLYTKNEVHIGLDIQDGTSLFAPTTYPANEAPIEVATAYKDDWWQSDQRDIVLYNHVTETYDWTNEFDLDQDFIDDYTVSSSGSDFYYTYIVKVGSDWKVYIWDVTNSEWDLWDTISGSSSTTNGDGWSAWEEYNFNGSCPNSIPEIAVPLVQVYDGAWVDADSDYATEYDSGSVCNIDNASFNSEFNDWTVDD